MPKMIVSMVVTTDKHVLRKDLEKLIEETLVGYPVVAKNGAAKIEKIRVRDIDAP